MTSRYEAAAALAFVANFELTHTQLFPSLIASSIELMFRARSYALACEPCSLQLHAARSAIPTEFAREYRY